jgi:hypothetical protein
MAAQVKRFRDHSARWQRDARKRGIDPAKWDRWRTLSPKVRKATNPVEYATGNTVRSQLRAPLLNAAVNQLVIVHGARGATRIDGQPIKRAAIRRSLDHPEAHMTNAKLRRLTNMSQSRLTREVDNSLYKDYAAGERSPFWYEKRG